ncbi:MAG: AAA family ATPase [Kiritimatiellaeota bacterium]|nr:AAA family ATPase [Kiritimatiellota bacterium]
MPASDHLPYVERHLQGSLRAALADTPVVCLLGPRQCGKSTLAAHQAPGRTYLNLDDTNYLDLARRDPQGLVADLPECVTIDEIQRAPGLILAIKRSVDADRRPGRFLLTGSASLLQLPRLGTSRKTACDK